MNKLFIPVLLGSARDGRYSEKAAHFVFSEIEKYGKFDTQLIDVRGFVSKPVTESAMTETKSKEWSEIMKRANGLIVVSPEYNHGYPGELKLMLDQLYDEYNRKPVGICGVSSRGIGGARMVEALKPVMIELQMVPIRSAIYFSNIKDLFDGGGAIKDSSYHDRLIKFFDELVWYASALKNSRQTM